MSYCSTLVEPITRRVKEGKNLDVIGKELCPDIKKPRQKIVRMIKSLLGDQYLIDNAKSLGYDTTRIEAGKRGGKTEKDHLGGKSQTLDLKNTLHELVKEYGYMTVENTLKEFLVRQ